MSPGQGERSSGLVNISIRILLHECTLTFMQYEEGPCPNGCLPKYPRLAQLETVVEITPGRVKGFSKFVVGAWRFEPQTS